MELATPFKDAIPPLSTAEHEQLEKRIRDAGEVLYPILISTQREITSFSWHDASKLAMTVRRVKA